MVAVSPVDGRYRRHVSSLADLCSEFGLIRYRVRIEIEWLMHLSDTEQFVALSELSIDTKNELTQVWKRFSIEDAAEIREIESILNHDVKAVEHFVRDRVAAAGAAHAREFVHFACTSEDINNLSYALMLVDCRSQCVLPACDAAIRTLSALARANVDHAMLSRTHGQVASPTTLGKELAVFVSRLFDCRVAYAVAPVLGKMNGAVGNFNAHVVADPAADWQAISTSFISRFGIDSSRITTQIEPHDYMTHQFHSLVALNQVLRDLCQDMWGYISLGYFRQAAAAGEVGSSTMPHKVNPIDFENAEGNIGIANALLQHLATKLPVSRWQRDLSDSTALRNVGTALAHTIIACKSVTRGLNNLEVDTKVIAEDLDGSWEVLTEAVQTVLRIEGVADAYGLVKRRARGRRLDRSAYREMVDSLSLSLESKRRLLDLTPDSYIGLASPIALRELDRVDAFYEQHGS